MPRFLFPEAEELNPLLRVKRKVTKALKAQYQGVESTIGQEANLEEKFNRVYQSMIRLTALLGEIDNSLKLSSVSPDKMISSISNATMEVANLLLFLSQEVPTLQIFNTNQIETITGLNNNLVGIVQEIDQISKSLDSGSLSRFRAVVSPLVRDVATLQQKLEGINTPAGVGSLTNFGKDLYDEDRTPAPSAQPQSSSGFDDNNDADFDMDTDDNFSEVKMDTDTPSTNTKRERERDFQSEKKRVKKEEEKEDEFFTPMRVPPSPFPSSPEPRTPKRERDGGVGEESDSKRSRRTENRKNLRRDVDYEGNERKRWREDRSEYEERMKAPKIKDLSKSAKERSRKAETEEPGFGLRRSKRNRKEPERYGGRFELMMPMGGASTHTRFL